MPTIDRYKGLRFFFYSELHEARPHVHVESPDGIAKFWLEPGVELSRPGGLKPRELSVAQERIIEKRTEYLSKWREYHE